MSEEIKNNQSAEVQSETPNNKKPAKRHIVVSPEVYAAMKQQMGDREYADDQSFVEHLLVLDNIFDNMMSDEDSEDTVVEHEEHENIVTNNAVKPNLLCDNSIPRYIQEIFGDNLWVAFVAGVILIMFSWLCLSSFDRDVKDAKRLKKEHIERIYILNSTKDLKIKTKEIEKRLQYMETMLGIKAENQKPGNVTNQSSHDINASLPCVGKTYPCPGDINTNLPCEGKTYPCPGPGNDTLNTPVVDNSTQPQQIKSIFNTPPSSIPEEEQMTIPVEEPVEQVPQPVVNTPEPVVNIPVSDQQVSARLIGYQEYIQIQPEVRLSMLKSHFQSNARVITFMLKTMVENTKQDGIPAKEKLQAILNTDEGRKIKKYFAIWDGAQKNSKVLEAVDQILLHTKFFNGQPYDSAVEAALMSYIAAVENAER